VKVGEGRGFVTKHRVRNPLFSSLEIAGEKFPPRRFIENRLVITAAHCLPELPPAHAASFLQERTWKLLGTLDGSKEGIPVECLFVNPVADIAVLGGPDSKVFEDSDLYEELIEAVRPLQIDKASSGPGWVLSLENEWIRTTLELFVSVAGCSLSIDAVEGGMSGSPILNDAGRAVGVIVVGRESVSPDDTLTNERCGPQPILTRDLPGWLLRP